jgi:hypothetical protein
MLQPENWQCEYKKRGKSDDSDDDVTHQPMTKPTEGTQYPGTQKLAPASVVDVSNGEYWLQESRK